eukprot:2997850-Pyramimonas_sp.AAC.1
MSPLDSHIRCLTLPPRITPRESSRASIVSCARFHALRRSRVQTAAAGAPDNALRNRSGFELDASDTPRSNLLRLSKLLVSKCVICTCRREPRPHSSRAR